MMQLRLMTTTGPLATLSTHEVESKTQAQALVDAHAAEHGITNVKPVNAGDYQDEGLRYTGTTPGGRSGRNIAYLEY